MDEKVGDIGQGNSVVRTTTLPLKMRNIRVAFKRLRTLLFMLYAI